MSRIETMRAAAEDSSHWWWEIGTAPSDLRDLLAVAEAAKTALHAHECDECTEDGCNEDWCPCAWHAERSGTNNPTCHDDVHEAEQVLRTALARLDAS